MQVPSGNEKSFDKWPEAAAFTKYGHFCDRWYTPIFSPLKAVCSLKQHRIWKL